MDNKRKIYREEKLLLDLERITGNLTNLQNFILKLNDSLVDINFRHIDILLDLFKTLLSVFIPALVATLAFPSYINYLNSVRFVIVIIVIICIFGFLFIFQMRNKTISKVNDFFMEMSKLTLETSRLHLNQAKNILSQLKVFSDKSNKK